MPQPSGQVTDHFSLAHFERALDKFSPPTGPFDATGAWRNTYELFMCIGGATRVGSLSIERAILGGGLVGLGVRYEKRAAGGSLVCRADLTCADDVLCTPLSWELESVVLDAAGKPIEDTRLAESASVKGPMIEVSGSGGARRTPLPLPFTLHWSLFDAVQRLGRQDTAETRFTLVDRLNNQVKPGQTLAFRKETCVDLGGTRVWEEERVPLEVGAVFRPVETREGATPTTLWAYEQFGQGILPIVYWVDQQGRLLFVLSGLIGYVLTPEAAGDDRP